MKKRILLVFILYSIISCKSTVSSEIKASDNTSPLVGTWELTYISENKNPINKVFAYKIPHINFDMTKDKITGNSGCNGFTSKVEINGHRISISEPSTKTMMFCEGESENLFFSMLQKADTYSVVDSHVLIFMKNGNTIMKFETK
jgi:heat shock protein HslJ